MSNASPANTAVKFDCPGEDIQLIEKIVDRCREMVFAEKGYYPDAHDKLMAMMDITVTHCNGCPLHLHRFLLSADYDFIHDFAGIRNNINRKTGKLENLFVPRFAKLD